MAKKRKQPELPISDQIEDLVELARQTSMPGGHLEDELYDACQSAAELAMESIQSSSLYEQLEFLYLHGYTVKEIQEIIEKRDG